MIGAASLPARAPSAGLHLVATPIGNLGDITLRALETLAGADAVLAEDTRVTARLLDRYAIRARLERHDAHAPPQAVAGLVARMAAGESLALVTDAGTPLVSDPGAALVRAALAAGVAVTALPGPSSVLAALSVAGLPAERFLFAGFLPSHAPERRRFITAHASVDATLVLLEAPHRLAESLADLADLLGDRPAAVARELTKLHETVTRGSLRVLAALHGAGGTRGEIVLVIGPPDGARAAAGEAEIDRRLTEALTTLSPRDAAAAVAAELGLPRRPVYARAIRIAAARDGR
jgi:16S rRNA (cytidine1402-2'-O)-methyltransferase